MTDVAITDLFPAGVERSHAVADAMLADANGEARRNGHAGAVLERVTFARRGQDVRVHLTARYGDRPATRADWDRAAR